MKSKYGKSLRWLHFGILFILLHSCLSAVEDEKDKKLKNAIAHLIEGTDPEVVRQNLYFLERQGADAFAVLVEAINDNRNAAGSLQEAKVIKQEYGNGRKLYITQVGDVALSLIRSRIEGNRSRFYHSYYVLSRTNIKQWLAERSGNTLTELRVDAAKQAFELVKKTYPNSRIDEEIRTISIFQNRIARIEAGASPDMK